MKSTLWSMDHIRTMTLYLYEILAKDFSTPVCIETCLATVARGYALRPNKDDSPTAFRIGLAWSSEAAFNWLGGRGYVGDPRTAFDAIAMLEKRHVLWCRERDAMALLQRRHARRNHRAAARPVLAPGEQTKAA